MSLTAGLREVVKGEVYDDAQTLEKFSRDASMFRVMPSVVVAPRDIADIKTLVNYALANPGVSLTPRAGGSDMTGGVLTESVVLDLTKYMNRLLDIGPDYAVVEPGMYYRDFERETLKKNLLMPSYPASRELCAIGGMVGNNAGGEKTLSYGKTEDYVQELNVVLSNGEEYKICPLGSQELEEKCRQDDFEGEIYKKTRELLDSNYDLIKSAKPNVSKNSAGYALWNIWDKRTGIFDLTKIFVGSQGTLGVITKVRLRLINPEPQKKLVVIFVRNQDLLPTLINQTLSQKPESFESYDDKTLKLVFGYFGGFVKRLGVANIFKLAASFLPELKLIITSGFPKLVLLAEFSGSDIKDVEERAQQTARLAKSTGAAVHIAKNDIETKKYWTIRREAFNLLREHTRNKRSVPFIDDLIVRPEKLGEFLPKLYETLDPYRDVMDYAIGGHSGDGNLHIYSIVNIKDPSVRKKIPEITDKVYDLVLRFGGSITAEHNDGLIRSHYLEKMYGPRVYKLFKEVKNIFDPKGIFNPGKKINSSRDYAFNHVINN